MVRLFASIMGLLGMVIVLLRALLHGSSLDATVPNAVMGMLVLSIVGAIVGAIAKGVVDDSVRLQLKREMEALSGTNTES